MTEIHIEAGQTWQHPATGRLVRVTVLEARPGRRHTIHAKDIDNGDTAFMTKTTLRTQFTLVPDLATRITSEAGTVVVRRGTNTRYEVLSPAIRAGGRILMKDLFNGVTCYVPADTFHDEFTPDTEGPGT